MKSTLILTTIAITLFASTVVAAPAKMQVSLSITPKTTLPGLSVPLYLRVRNGARAVELSPWVQVRATSPVGESFFAAWEGKQTIGELEFGVTDEEDARFVLPANATVDLEVPALDLSQPSWALDQRLLALPGEWTLEVLIYEVDEDAPQNPEPAGVSNPVKLTIDTPTGRDVPVWEALRAGAPRGISEKVFTEQPESKYFPFMSTLISRHGILDKVAIINRAIDLHPNSPVVPSLRYAIALYYGMEARHAFSQEGNLDKAVALADRGRAELTRLKNGTNAWSRLKGNQKLGEFPSREYFVELQRLKQGKAAKKP